MKVRVHSQRKAVISAAQNSEGEKFWGGKNLLGGKNLKSQNLDPKNFRAPSARDLSYLTIFSHILIAFSSVSGAPQAPQVFFSV